MYGHRLLTFHKTQGHLLDSHGRCGGWPTDHHRPTCQRAPHVVILLPEGNMPKSSQIYTCILTWCSSDDLLIFAGYLTHFAGYTHQFGWVKVLNPTIFPYFSVENPTVWLKTARMDKASSWGFGSPGAYAPLVASNCRTPTSWRRGGKPWRLPSGLRYSVACNAQPTQRTDQHTRKNIKRNEQCGASWSWGRYAAWIW